MSKLHFDGPINSLSLGNVSFNFLRELWKKNIDVSLFPTGDQADFSAYTSSSKDLIEWIKECGFKRFEKLDQNCPTLKNWHINGSEKRIGKSQFLYTYYEVDSPTDVEISIVKNQTHVFFSSSFAAEAFRKAGCDNVSYVPVGFDEDFKEEETFFPKDIIHFGLIGKFEKRKNTEMIIRAWLKKYGNNPKYQLSCLINNPFIKAEDFKKIVSNMLDNKSWSNINFLPRLEKNSEVNLFMNAIDIDLSGFSNGEGWNLGAFNSTALGKWSIVSNCSSHKDWANENNAILVDPIGMQECYDDMFFRKGLGFNQGNYFLLSEESLIDAMERAERKAKIVNEEGKKLKEDFSYCKSIDKILEKML